MFFHLSLTSILLFDLDAFPVIYDNIFLIDGYLFDFLEFVGQLVDHIDGDLLALDEAVGKSTEFPEHFIYTSADIFLKFRGYLIVLYFI